MGAPGGTSGSQGPGSARLWSKPAEPKNNQNDKKNNLQKQNEKNTKLSDTSISPFMETETSSLRG